MNPRNTGASKAQELYELLLSVGIPVKKFSCPLNNVGAFYNSVKTHSFAGSDAAKLLAIWDVALNIVFDREVWDVEHPKYSSTSADTIRCRKAVSLWKYWQVEVWPLINDLHMEKETKAAHVEAKGRKFIDLWVTATGMATSHLYPHILVKHLPDAIRHLPLDPWYFQTEALEHRHKLRKQFSMLTNKHKPKLLSERTCDTSGYYRHGKWIQGKSGKGTGPCRNYQMLGKSVVYDHLLNLMSTGASEEAKWERSKLARERRNQLKCTQILQAHAKGVKTLGEILSKRVRTHE